MNAGVRKGREEEVTGGQENDYSKLRGDCVNDYLNSFEDACDWSSFLVVFDLTPYNNQKTYSLTNFGIRGELMSLYNVSDTPAVTQRTEAYITDTHYKDHDDTTGNTRYF